MKRYLLIILLLSCVLLSCAQKGDKDSKEITLVFKHGKIAGDPRPLRALLERFEESYPGIKVKDETLPSSTDEQHQFYVINLEGKCKDFDVISMDVIWVQEFARAGWIRDLSSVFGQEEMADFFPGPIRAVTYKGRVFAIPWYIDAGILYYRKDLLEKYGLLPPKTWYQLVDIASTIIKKERGIYGFIWQGKQYEGLVCNVLEYMWGNGGGVFKDGRLSIYSKENIEALRFIRDLIFKYKVSPRLVTTATEEVTRHIFGKGRAVFMRNWPYAWHIFEREGSVVKGKIGICPLPSFPGFQSASVLGGWQLGINRYSKHPKEAEKLVKFLTSPYAQKALALSIGYKPPRRSLYCDPELIEKSPFIARLYNIFLRARPRPVTPYYMMIAQIMQPEFSAVISGIKEPKAALRSINRQIDYLLRLEE